jgi:hypothetical protein
MSDNQTKPCSQCGKPADFDPRAEFGTVAPLDKNMRPGADYKGVEIAPGWRCRDENCNHLERVESN